MKIKNKVAICIKCGVVVADANYPDIPDSSYCKCQADFQCDADPSLWKEYISVETVLRLYEELASKHSGLEGIAFIQDEFGRKLKSWDMNK